MIELNKIYNGDCLDVMKNFPDNIANLVLTSPPYNMNLRIRNGKHCSRKNEVSFSKKYHNFTDDLSMQEYYDFNKEVIKELLRISPIVFYNVQFLTGNKSALYKLIGEYALNIKEFIVWDKMVSQPAMGDSVLNSRFEVILVLAKEDDAISRMFKQSTFDRGTLENLWQIPRNKNVSTLHKATFSPELARQVILNFTKENDIVLDPFMGLGTTALTCIKANRNFIGIEIDKTYCDIANQRIENEYSQTKLAI